MSPAKAKTTKNVSLQKTTSTISCDNHFRQGTKLDNHFLSLFIGFQTCSCRLQWKQRRKLNMTFPRNHILHPIIPTPLHPCLHTEIASLNGTVKLVREACGSTFLYLSAASVTDTHGVGTIFLVLTVYEQAAGCFSMRRLSTLQIVRVIL